MAHQFNTPAFKNEQEEADWWDSHEDEILAAFEEAAKNGTLGRGTLAKHGVAAFEMLTGDPKEEPEKRKSAA